MKGDAVRLAQLSAQIQTVGSALGVIGVARSHLDTVESIVSTIPLNNLVKDSVGGFWSWITGATGQVTDQLAGEIAQARGELDRHASHFVGYVGDDLQQEISTAHSMGIASTLQYVNKVCNNAIDAFNNTPAISALDFVQAIADVLQAAVDATARAAQSVAQSVANVAAGVASAFWVPLLVIGAGVALVFAHNKGLLKKVVP